MTKFAYFCLTVIVLGLIALGGLSPKGAAMAQEVAATPAVAPCDSPIVYSSKGRVNVRSGPGTDYDTVGILELFEMRPVVGRAAFAQWWLVEMLDGTLGWVASDAVDVYGNGANAPIVAVPELGGVTPTPGEPWLVTPDPACVVLNTPTPTPTETPVAPVEDEDFWSIPTNLSRSGAATTPQIVVDSNGRFHALWLDEIDGFVYASGDGFEWTAPAVAEFPFGTRRFYPDLKETQPTPYFVPHLLTDNSGRLHAFWIDDSQILYYSSVAGDQVTSFDKWSTRVKLADAALALDVAVDAAGRIHLAFIRPVDETDAPAGLYYAQLPAGDDSWSSPTLLYQSLYFRSLTDELAHLDIVAPHIGENDVIFVALDDRPQEKIILLRSDDNGQNWDNVRDVDRRQPTDPAQATSPSQVVIGIQGNNLILIWQAGHEEADCTEYFQSSSDGGLTWQEPQPFSGLRGCSKASQFFTTSNGLLILFTIVGEVTGDNIYLLAWNGQKWSDPQAQETLLSFTNPDTYRVIQLGCHQAILVGGSTLFVAGCDTEGNKDVWLTNRPLGDANDWFPPPPIWSSPELLHASDLEPLSLQMVADSQNNLHAIWSQSDGLGIFYSSWNGTLWSPAVTILRTPNGRAYQPTLTINAQDQLFVVWSGDEPGTIYFSWAPAEEGSSATGWAAPALIPAPRASISSSAILVGGDNQIYVAFAIPLNEERGIYFTRSTDRGASWSIPNRVINAPEKGLAMVDRPKLTLTGPGDLHLIWTEFSLPPVTEPIALYYSRLLWHQDSWSEPEQVVRTQVDWAMAVGFGQETVHRLWLTGSSGNATLWHQISSDGGSGWSEAESIAGVGSGNAPTWLTMTVDGQLHLLQLFSGQLLHWNWNGSWVTNQADLLTHVAQTNGLAGVALPTGRLEVIYSGAVTDPNTGDLGYNIYFTGRGLTAPSVIPTPAIYPTLTPQPLPTLEPSPTPTITPTTVVFPTELTPRKRLPIIGRLPTNPWFTMILGVVPVLLLVIIIFAYALRRVRVRQQ